MNKKNLSDKVSFASSFPQDGLEFCIIQIEEAIIKSKVLLSEREPNFKEIEEMYLKERREISAIQEDINKKTLWLNGLIANRGKNLGKTDIRIIRTTSHTMDKHKNDYSKRVSWMTPTVEILEKERRFLTMDELFNLIVQNYPECAKMFNDGYKLAIKNRVFHNWERSTTQESKRGNPSIVAYRGKIGLYKWMVKDKQLDSFLKDFLFQPSDHELETA